MTGAAAADERGARSAAPIVPYLMLVLMLIVRPRGLFGTRDA